MDAKRSSASRTAKIAAKETNQFTDDQIGRRDVTLQQERRAKTPGPTSEGLRTVSDQDRDQTSARKSSRRPREGDPKQDVQSGQSREGAGLSEQKSGASQRNQGSEA